MGARGSKTTPQEKVINAYEANHQRAEEINDQAHKVLKEFQTAIENSGFTDQKVCDKLAIVYERRLRQFEPKQLQRLGLMLGLEANDAAFGDKISYEEAVDQVCQDIIAFYKLKIDVLTYLLQQTEFCVQKSKEVNELFQQNGALTIGEDGELPYDAKTYKVAVDLDNQVVAQYKRLRNLANALILDQTMTARELESLFAKTKKVVEASNAVCGARSAVVESQMPRATATASS